MNLTDPTVVRGLADILRSVLGPEEVDDAAAARIARETAQKIQSEADYPAEIKVVVIRETRSVDFAGPGA